MAIKKIEVLYHPCGTGTPGEPFTVPKGSDPQYYIKKGFREQPCDGKDCESCDAYYFAVLDEPTKTKGKK